MADRGRQVGIRRFTALVAADNTAVVGLLHESRTGVRVTHRESGTVEYEITLPPRGLGDELQAVLRAFGRSQVEARLRSETPLAALASEDFTGRGPGPGS